MRNLFPRLAFAAAMVAGVVSASAQTPLRVAGNFSQNVKQVEIERAFFDALPVIVKAPRDVEAREKALYGAWLCGTVLGTVGMALHHKICHTLGGTFDTPHAETHAVMLPHTAAFNAVAVPDLLAPVAEIFGGSVGGGLWDFAKAAGAPLALRDLGLSQGDLDLAADIATQNPYRNPRAIDRPSIRVLLQAAWEGRRPD